MKTARITIRVSEIEKERIQFLASKQNLSVNEYMKNCALNNDVKQDVKQDVKTDFTDSTSDITDINRITVEALIKQLETKDNQINQLQSLLYSKIPNQLEMTDVKTDNTEDVKETSQPIVNTQQKSKWWQIFKK